MPELTFKLLPELPPPPPELVATLDREFRPRNDEFSPRSVDYLEIQRVDDWKKQSYEWIQPMASNKNKRKRFEADFIDWIRRKITLEFQESNSGVMFFDEPQLPHTDLTRDYVLLYNLETGGPDAEVCFWREKGKPLVRERMLALERGPRLELLDSAKGPWGCWYLMNTRIIHSVEKMSCRRTNLQVSFDTELPDSFVRKYLGREK